MSSARCSKDWTRTLPAAPVSGTFTERRGVVSKPWVVASLSLLRALTQPESIHGDAARCTG